MSRPRRRLAAAAAVALAAGFLPAILPAIGPATGAAPDDAMYAAAPRFEPTGPRVRVRPARYAAVKVDLARVRRALAAAPRAGADDSLVFRVPTPAGGTERFAIRRTVLMQARLAAAHPEIRTYAGRSLEHAGTTIALDVTPMGFHASVRGAEGRRAWYVDPAFDKRGTTTHLSYYGGSVPRTEDAFVEREAPEVDRAVAARTAGAQTAPGGLVRQRVYRLALTSDPSYAAYFGTDNVLSQKVTLVNRVNQIYHDDLAISLRLVDATDALNLDTEARATGPDGPCGAHPCFEPAVGDPSTAGHVPGQLDFCDVPTLGRNRVVLGQLVGAGNYDVGHLALGVNGGGIAYLGVVGRDYKAGGCTGLPQPQGDFYALDYVAHELGHQFAGNHTFNGVRNACSGGNRSRGTSVEPGSGSSVMAYAGICGQDDLQPHTDPYFSQRTIDEISDFVRDPAYPVVEVQTVSLEGFDSIGEAITLGYRAAAPVTLTLGTDYDAAGVEAAVEQLTGTDVTVAGWGYDPFASPIDYPAPLTEPDETGFQVSFAGDAAPDTTDSDFADMAPLTVSSASPGVSGFVGETARGGGADNRGFETVVTDNHAPRVRAPADRTIPLRTPFTLEGSGTDVDGDDLAFLWEQNDAGGRRGTSLITNRKRTGPLFRIFGTSADVTPAGSLQIPSPGQNHATSSPSRTFPDLRQVLAGHTNARKGTCPQVARGDRVRKRVLDCYSEFLPVEGYVGRAGSTRPAMHFRLTARDGAAGGGGTAYDDVTLRISQRAGPFLVTSQRTAGESVRGGRKARVTWDVNGTRRLAQRVRIVLSTDGGRTWPRVLASSTANDGAKKVRFPRKPTQRARIRIEAVDNYFFDTNDHRFRIR